MIANWFHDMTRCHDVECPLGPTCARFQKRGTAGFCTVHTMSLREPGAHHCSFHIHVSDLAGKPPAVEV
jgi:hypothetical protein